jgi:hypothetical protein
LASFHHLQATWHIHSYFASVPGNISSFPLKGNSLLIQSFISPIWEHMIKVIKPILYFIFNLCSNRLFLCFLFSILFLLIVCISCFVIIYWNSIICKFEVWLIGK